MQELARKDGVVRACSVSPVVEFWAGLGAGSFGCSLLKVFSASLLSVHVCRSFDPLAAQDGTVTAKLRPKEDSDCRSLWSSASVQITSRQEDLEGKDKFEPAFQVESFQAIVAAPCEVEFGRMSARTIRYSKMWTS